jgi:predicted esterase
MIEHRITTPRRARYYVAGQTEDAREVWIVLHGYGQLAADFLLPFAPIVTDQRAVVAPEALNRYYKDAAATGSHATTQVGTTWMTRADRENEIADYVDFLDGVRRAVVPEGARLVVLGFSQGVATAVRWVAHGNAGASRLVLWAGNLPPEIEPSALRARLPDSRLELVVGSVDEFVEWIRVDEQRARLESAAFEVDLTIFDGGHRLDRETLLTLANRQESRPRHRSSSRR